jgi:multiple sugar transport system ATP-binding protein
MANRLLNKMAEVRLDKIRKRMGTLEVIPDLSLTVHDGELFTLVGPSGCGKSTLLHLIAGLEAPTGGQIYFDKDDVTDRAPRERDVALVFQNYALYPHMTVADNLAFPLRVSGRHADVQAEVRRIAETLGLEALLDRRPRELSGGQRQRVALGRAIIRKPRVFLLDEPLSNLDAQLRSGMRAELRRLHDELGITMIYVTHDQTEAMTLADRLAVLNVGRVQQVGTPKDVYDRPANVFVAGFMGQPAMNLLKATIMGASIVAEPIRLPRSAHSNLLDQEVILGLRPEEIRVGISTSETGHSTQGRITLVEPAAGQTWITVELMWKGRPVSIVGLGEPKLKLKPGEAVPVSFSGAIPHLFDTQTGHRLGESFPTRARTDG